jgi:hypothetical protein
MFAQDRKNEEWASAPATRVTVFKIVLMALQTIEIRYNTNIAVIEYISNFGNIAYNGNIVKDKFISCQAK